MPTGYTAYIYDGGTDFKEFVLRCSKAFLFRMKEDGREIPPEQFEVDDYYFKELQKALKKQNEFLVRSDEELRIQHAEENAELELYYIKSNRENVELRERLETMLQKANDWVPPTEEHDGLKDFMIEQIETTIKWDCHDYSFPTRKTFEEWKEQKANVLIKDITYYTNKIKKEREHVKSDNKWIKELRESL